MVSCDSHNITKDHQQENMFTGWTAWFSSSVPKQAKVHWEQYGGTLATEATAMYLFTADASSADTLKIYESIDYLRDHVALFHPKFINDCLREGDPRNVVLGKYFVPPETIREELKVSQLLGEVVFDHGETGRRPIEETSRTAGRQIIKVTQLKPTRECFREFVIGNRGFEVSSKR